MPAKTSLEDELFCLSFELRLLADSSLHHKLERWIEGFSPRRVEVEHVQRYQLAARYSADRTVLDLACGTGRGSRMLAEEGGARQVTGGDVDAPSIRYAAVRNGRDNLEFVVQDGLTLDHHAAYDLVVCYETIEHVRDPGRLLKNLARALKPDGQMLISTPISVFDADENPPNPYHFREWGLKPFQAFLAEEFDIAEVFVQYCRAPAKPTLGRRILNKMKSKLRITPAARREAEADADTTVDKWTQAGLDPGGVGKQWAGYQIVRCAPRAK